MTDRLPIVLVPGLDGTGLTFYRQVPLLARQHAVRTTRLRDRAGSMDELVADLHGEVEAAAPDGGRVLLVGESFGGALSLSYALAHPERVGRMVILNSFSHYDRQARLRLGYHALRIAPWGAMRWFRRLTASRVHSRETSADEVRHFQTLMNTTTRSGYLSRLKLLQRYDLRDRLHAITVPVLYLAADRDHVVAAVEHARFMTARTPGSRMRVLEGHGHVCLIAPSVDLAAVLDDWLTAE